MALASASYAQDNYSIPVDSWIYPAIEQLQTRGYLLDLSPGFKPYRRMDVAEALQLLIEEKDVSRLPKTDRWLIQKLQEEFRNDMRVLRVRKAHPDTSITSARVSEEDFLNLAKGDYQTFKYANKLEFRPELRTGFGLSLGNHLLLYTDATIDQTLKDDTLYTGSTKFGLDALTQQAYVRYSSRYWDFTFGRDYLSWGYGDQGKVLISSTPGPFNMASLFVDTKAVKFNWFVAQLNQMPAYTLQDTANLTGIPLANRYLTGSRFEFNIANELFLGAYQAATFGGVNSPIDLEIINPLRVTYETEANSHKNLNAFLGSDLSLYWPRDVNFYADFMIDDWAVDHKTVGDLSPNKYSINMGLKLADPLVAEGIGGTNAQIEFWMVRNRTYNEYDWVSYQKLLFNNYPVATPYGDDFWDIDFRLSQWLTKSWELSVEAMHMEHGSMNMYGPYTMPWLSVASVQLGYHEPFPYGVIQETNIYGLHLMYQPGPQFYGSLQMDYSDNRNFDYVSGLGHSQFSFLLTIYYELSRSFSF